MTKEEMANFMRYWYRLKTKNRENGETLSSLLKQFAVFLSFTVLDSCDGDSLYAYVYVDHSNLHIYGDSNKALLFGICNENEEDALEIYSCLRSVIYSKGLSDQPAAILVLNSTPAFDGYCRESPLEFIRLDMNRVAQVLSDRHDKPRMRFSSFLREQSVTDIVNPYRTAGPVVGSMFFGRKPELKKITNPFSAMETRTSFALIGPRKSGKSSLLLTAKAILDTDDDVLAEYIDCYTYHTAAQVMYEITTRLQPRATVRWEPDKFPHFLSLMRHKKEYVLFLDEIDEIAEQDLKSGNKLFSALGGAPRFRVVLAGHLKLLATIRNSQSMLYNLVEKVDVVGLDNSSGRNLIVDPLLSLGFKLKDGFKMLEYILEQSANRPALIQLYCRELVNQARRNDQNELGLEEVKLVEQNRTFCEEVLDTFLIGTTPLSRLIVLLMIEIGGNTSITEDLLYGNIQKEGVECKFEKLIEAINSLEDPGIITRRGKFLNFGYPAFPRLIQELHNIKYFKEETLNELK
jgi:hypothetical protein